MILDMRKAGIVGKYKGCEIHMMNNGSLYFTRGKYIGFYEYDSSAELQQHIDSQRGIHSEAWK